MGRIWIAVLFLACWAISISPAADLKTYKDVYDKSLEEIVLGHGPKLQELQQQYAKSLEVVKARVQGGGDLEKTKAVMGEIERFQKDKNIPLDSALPELKKLQNVFLKQLTDLEQDKARRVSTLVTQYDTVLEKLQKELTKAGKIDEATVIQGERDKVKSSDYTVAANRVTATVSGKENNNVERVKNAGSINVSGVRQTDRPAYLSRFPLLEGFSKPLEWYARKSWGTYRDEDVQSFWAHAQGKDLQISWETQVVDQKGSLASPCVTFVFGGGMGFDKERTGTWKLEVNGQQALQVRFPVEESTLWEQQEYRLYFEHLGVVHLGYKGIYFLTVPRQALKMGSTQQIRFREHAQPDDKEGWVMVNEYTDMITDISRKNRNKRLPGARK